MDETTKALLDFVKKRIVKSSATEITEDTVLVSSGLIDSFTLPELLIQLETLTGRKISTGRVSPQDFETVRAMLNAANRVGQAKT
jgi:acyl carrier protein